MEETNRDILQTLEQMTSTITTLRHQITELEYSNNEMSDDIIKLAADNSTEYLAELSQKMVETMTTEMSKYYTEREGELNCRAAADARAAETTAAKLEYVYENMRRLLNHDVCFWDGNNKTYLGKKSAYKFIATCLGNETKFADKVDKIVYYDIRGDVKPCNGLDLFTKEDLKQYVAENADIIMDTDVRISIRDIAADIRAHYHLYSLTVDEIESFIRNNLVRADAAEII
jgi:hypothetical protein